MCYNRRRFMVEIIEGSELAKGFTTTVGIISSRGSLGDNLMACEWTYLVSYKPAMISIHIGNYKSKATAENITETKVFGVSLTASHQNPITSIIGNNTGHKVDKIAALNELGFTFERGEETGVLLVPDSVFMAECKLVKIEPMGDHTMFLGEVVHAKEGTSTEPILYNMKTYRSLGGIIERPTEEKKAFYKEIVAKHLKPSS